MGDVSIIARRLSDGQVQYGWSGNGGYFRNTGYRLLAWYQDAKDVEYLFGLGQTRLIGKIGSEHGGYNMVESHSLTGEEFWLASTERMIFSQIAFVDYGYFYDLDHEWYYIMPGPFRVKLRLELIYNNVDDNGYEFDYLRRVQDKILRYIFTEYKELDPDFMKLIEEKGYDSQEILNTIYQQKGDSLYILYDRYRNIYKYFDDWILVKANSDYTKIEQIVMRKKADVHVETCVW